jgi:hypothetical protein
VLDAVRADPQATFGQVDVEVHQPATGKPSESS